MSDAPKTPVPARPASTVVILRDGPGGIEVFMVVRHHQIDFASGALVFPGGKVDAEDSDAAWGELAPNAPNAPDRSFFVAAGRETFEEAGLVLARRRGTQEMVDADGAHRLVETYRTALLKSDTTFVDIVREENLALAADLMVPFAHWITPEVVPKRFDTHFFLIAAPVVQLGAHDGGEFGGRLVDHAAAGPERGQGGHAHPGVCHPHEFGEACTLPDGGRGSGDHALTPGCDGHAESNENAGRPQVANPRRSGLWRDRSVRRGRVAFWQCGAQGLNRSHRRRLDVDELDVGIAVGHP